MKTSVKRRSFLILVLCIVLAAATVLCMAGCKKKESPKADPSAQIVDKGTGAKKFEFDVVHKNGDSKRFMIHTDKDTIGSILTARSWITTKTDITGPSTLTASTL